MRLRNGDIVLIEVPFHQAAGGKIRPAIVVLDSGDADLIVAPVTSRVRGTEFELNLAEWRAAGLNVPSAVRLDKLATLSKADVRRVAGRLLPGDIAQMDERLCAAYCRDQRRRG